MTEKCAAIYRQIKEKFQAVLEKYNIDKNEVSIISCALSPEEAIGITERKDYPILTGKDVMLQASYQGSFGQAFTDAPASCSMTLNAILDMDILEDTHARGLFFATVNAVMRHLGLIEGTVHCKGEEPPQCALRMLETLRNQWAGKKLALIGYQPSLFQALSGSFDLRVLDLNPENVGQERFGHLVEHGLNAYDDAVLHWADLVLCTSSTFCNATVDRYVDIGKPVIFFGISGAGACHLLGLSRMCPLGR